MARYIPASPILHLPFSSIPMTLLSLVLAVLSVISIVTFLCGGSNSGKMKKLHKQTEEASSDSKDATLLSKLNSNLSHKALSMVKMISWRKVQAEEEEEEEKYSDEEGDEALWRKNILMGERCRPLEFSGKIVYDSQGNIIPDSSDHPKGYNY